MKYLPPLIHDLVFRSIFTKRPDLLIDLVNCFPMFQGNNRLKELNIENTILEPDSLTGKTVILDLFATDVSGQNIIVEVQNYKQDFFGDRALYYLSRVFSRQLLKAGEYDTLNSSHSLNFLNFRLFPGISQYLHSFSMTHNEIPEIELTKKMKVHIVELTKLKKFSYLDLTPLEAWMIALKTQNPIENKDSIQEILKKYPNIEEAYKEYELLAGSNTFLNSYESRRKSEMDYNNIIKTAVSDGYREGIDKGMEKGIKQGIKQGLEQGLEQGIEKGILKGIEKGKLEDARLMISKGYPISDILEITGLSKTQLKDENII